MNSFFNWLKEFFDFFLQPRPQPSPLPSIYKQETPSEPSAPLITISKEDFPLSISHASRIVPLKGIPLKAIIAVATLETASGQGNVFRHTRNLFSITSSPSWKGATFTAKTGFVFRVYPNLSDSIADFVRLISTNQRYKPTFNALISNDLKSGFRELQLAGYAGSDIAYAQKLEAVA